MATTTKDDAHVAQTEKIEYDHVSIMKGDALHFDKVDEFGAHAKTDPREIKLVKKLDLYIMVSSVKRRVPEFQLTCSSQCYGSCTFSTFSIGMP